MTNMTDQQPDNPFAGGMPDLGGLLESAQQMMANAQAAADEIVEGAAGGGLVKIEVDGRYEFHSVTIDPRSVDPDDETILEDLVLAALRDASTKLQKRQEGAISGMGLGGMGLGDLDLGSMGLGALGSGDQPEDQ